MIRPNPAPRATLRLFDPDAPDAMRPRAPAEWTVRDCYEALVRPELHGRKPATIGEYETHIRRFEEFCGLPPHESGYRTGRPVLIPAIDKPLLLAFRAWLAARKDAAGVAILTPRTVNKHVTTIRAVLRAAEAEGHLSRVPKVEPLAWRKARAKLYLDYDQLSRLYEACHVATWPRKLVAPAPTYWRCLLVIYFNFGLRTEEAARYDRKSRALCGANVSWDEQSPDPDSQARNPLGWLRYVPEKQERSKPEALTLPLNAVTHAHLRAIEPPGGWQPEQPIFPFPLSRRSFYATWEKIRTASGVRPPAGSSEPDYLLLHLRKTCTTWHNRVAGWPIAQFITGHADERGDVSQIAMPRLSRVSQEHYDNQELTLLEHIARFPQPPAFEAIF